MKIIHVVGARPNFMKVAPVLKALRTFEHVEQMLVHTGQHYDVNMSDIFFQELAIPTPDYNLEVGSGSHTYQTAQVMLRFEEVVNKEQPDAVVVYGDVNSTLAAALVCAKTSTRLAHVEAGLRSFDRSMPEEINRLVTDRLADLLFTPSSDGDFNLIKEGVEESRIFMVGNVMIDTLIQLLPLSQKQSSTELDRYILVTLHRPSNVDEPHQLTEIINALRTISEKIPIVFPIHPRTRKHLADLNLAIPEQIHIMDPVGYIEFLGLQKNATAVITDSGGVQEESTYLRVPCLTVRENTERPITIEIGTNQLIGKNMNLLVEKAGKILNGEGEKGEIPPLWDGNAGSRIAKILADHVT